MVHARSRPILITLTGVLTVLLGLGLLLPGIWLLTLGGSAYYAIAGVALVAAGALLATDRRAGIWLYALYLIGSVVWVIASVGFDGWRMIPPLAAPAVFGIWIFSPWIAGKMHDSAGRSRFNGVSLGGMGACAALFVFMFVCGWTITSSRFIHPSPFPDRAATGAVPGVEANGNATPGSNEWRYYGGTPAGDRYATPSQITAANVGHLTRAWTFHTGDLPRPGENSRGREFSFEATPIKVGDRLYFCTPHRDVIALDATTGKQVWRYSPRGEYGANIYQACRGVSYFEAPEGAPCAHRIVSTDSGSPPTLFELDADTGQLCQSFGHNGVVDLRDGMGDVPPGFHFITSPPMVIHNRIMTSGWVYDNQSVGEPSGVIRGFDATTGQLAWAWDMDRMPTNKPLDPGETFTRGTPNGWGVYTADPKLNMVYIPLGTPTPDYFGGQRRPTDEKYDSSVVALDIETGLERWHFQTTHHDLWDFDLPIGPSLVDLPDAQGNMVPALVQTNKQGELFVLDRRTGKPFYRVDEVPVPKGDIPGEHYSPTQPLSVDMPNLRRPNPTEDDMWGATPFDQLACRIVYHRERFQGLYTPPSLNGTIGNPAFDGVADWYGATIDPTRRVLYVNTTYIPFLMNMVTQKQGLSEGLYKPWAGWGHPYPEPVFTNNPQHGLPYGIVVKPWLGIFGAPCLAPPWGLTQAIDLQTRKVIWQRALGTTKNVGPGALRMPLGLPTGIFSMGGSLITSTNLLFMGATADQAFRVLDARNGSVLYETELDAGGNATPMTYTGKDGRQYVVIAVGGHGGLKTRNGDEVVAFALPKQGQ
ncbi:membrane-bound PQQ-dependent dehydrogenase, glucose/quinate/shikimate family [Tanticharoenia sakaeratensis]|uniref:membrane-bound PQQ-dependent dehydrogenase, glucose/quinate/shikimate family n=1 Tax=Tanticharoenia sakaeratensis TaxID=444053 RepID=UPI0006620DCB|nr:membrane-bound PQQ-dependent dehydrogenase, glucose/quinate/shikimate family [Tanticharoenia sakaeratensis]